MPRYLSTSPFEQVLQGFSVGRDGVAVFPANDRPDPIPGTTVLLDEGDEIEAPTELHFPGAYRLDTTPAAPAAPTAAPAEEPQP